MKNKYQLIIITSIISFSTGIIITILFKKYSFFSLSNNINVEINPFDVLGMALTFFVAFYVTRKLTKDNEREKAEKELLISYFKDFRNNLKVTINRILDEKLFDTMYAKSSFKILRQTLRSNIKLAESHSFLENNSDLSSKMKEVLANIWEVSTDTPKLDDKMWLETTKQEIFKNMIIIDELLFKIILEINKK